MGSRSHNWAICGLCLCLEAVSGSRVNLAKSQITPIGPVSALPAMLGCKMFALPISYVGLLLGSSFKEVVVWDRVVERVQRRLAGWKKYYLSKGGKLTLIKSTLSSIPTYFYLCIQFLLGWLDSWKNHSGIFCGRGWMGFHIIIW